MRQIKKNFREGPRYKPESIRIFGEDFFRRFYKQNPEFVKFKEEFPKAKLKSFIKDFHRALGELAIEEHQGFAFPNGLGQVFLAKVKPTKKPCNQIASQKVGREIPHANVHSDGYLLSIRYGNKARLFNFTFKELWKFKAGSEFKKKASKAFEKNWERYMTLEDTRSIRKRHDDFYKENNLRLPKHILKIRRKY